MAGSQFNLLRTKRFLPLFVTQGLGAFNDNVLKNAISILITYRLATAHGVDAPTIIAVAAGLFILPFFLFSGLAGQLADKCDKAWLSQKIKLAEIFIMAFGAFSLWAESISLQLFALFLTGTQSSFFGPIKYGILPQHLKDEELLGGNGLIEAGTFLTILLGTIFGGLLILTSYGLPIVSATMIAVAVAGWYASWRIPAAPPPDPDIKVNRNILSSTWHILEYATENRNVLLAILGISWFWFLGAVFLAEMPVLARDVLRADEKVANLFNVAFVVGIGVGSMLTNRLLKGEVSPRHVPFAAIAVTVVIVDLWAATSSFADRSNSTELMTIGAFLSTWQGWHVLIDLALIALFGGIFVVPLYAFVQSRSNPQHVSRVIAANNVINAIFMTAASVFIVAALTANLTVPQIFLIVGILNAGVAIYITKLLPQEFVKYLGRRIFRLFYRVEVKGMENYHAAGDRVVIVANHTSYLDGVLLGSFLPDRCAFAINTHVSREWWTKPAFWVFDMLSVDPTNPLAAREMVKFLQKDQKIVIFPEGRITVTGALMKVYEGPGTIANMADAKVLPIRIDGAQFSIFSKMRGKLRLRLFPKITITVLEPQDFSAPEGVKGNALRQILAHRLYDVMTSMVFRTSTIDQHLFEALIDAKSTHGGGHKILEDVQRTPLTYSRLVTGSFVLGRKLARLTEGEKTVGVLLPNAAGAFVTYFGLLAYGRTPAMLNFSTGAVNMAAACVAAQVKTIMTSRRFIEIGNMEDVIALLEKQAKIVYLEDVRETVGPLDKLRGLATSLAGKFALRWTDANRDPNTPAVILFTSGSEGVPKGVVLSHRNIRANMNQIAARIDFTTQDMVFNALPMFHAFGLTGGTLLPALSGVKTFLYPSPLHYKIVPELVYDTNATIMFGTDTFLAGYARNAHPYDFYNVRYVVAGAERVKPETRDVWMNKFGLRILEGYGATECSPVLAVNTPMHFRVGSVGRFLDGMQHTLEPVDGIEDGGRLIVKGPNIMLGYLRADNPGQLEPPADGWYDTGDIVDIDELGFVTIKGRAKRFAKIGGEMVSLTAVETQIGSAFKEHDHAVVAVPDPRKGEQLVLITTHEELDRKQLSTAMKKAGLTELMIPRNILPVAALPVLGSGKIDYVTINEMARGKQAAE